MSPYLTGGRFLSDDPSQKPQRGTACHQCSRAMLQLSSDFQALKSSKLCFFLKQELDQLDRFATNGPREKMTTSYLLVSLKAEKTPLSSPSDGFNGGQGSDEVVSRQAATMVATHKGWWGHVQRQARGHENIHNRREENTKSTNKVTSLLLILLTIS